MLFQFGDIAVKNKLLLHSAEFEIEDRGLFVIKGDNGSGKSLLLNYLFQVKSNSGEKVVFIDQTNDRIIKRKNILSNIVFSDDEDKMRQIKKQLDKMGYNYLLEHKSDKLSGGEKRLVCLLRGLLSNADCYFIDEPTNDLDIETTRKMIEFIDSIKKNAVVFVISHDDRLEPYIDGELCIKNKELISDDINIRRIDKNIDYTEKCSENKTEKNSFLKELFPIRYITILLCVIYMFVALYVQNAINEAYENQIEPMAEGQMDIYVPVSEYGSEIKQGALPIKYALLLSGNAEISDIAEIFNEDDSKRIDVNFTLDIETTEKYTVYELEYYDISSHKNYLIIEEYCREYEEDAYVNTSQYFDLPGNYNPESNTGKTLDIQKYNDCVHKYKQNKQSELTEYELVYCSIVLNDKYTMYDLYIDEKFSVLIDGNFYIMSNETIAIVNAATVLRAEKDAFFVLIVVGMIGFLIDVIYSYVYLRTNRSIIRIFRNMNESSRNIRWNIVQKTKDGFIRICSCFVMLIMFLLNIYDVSKLGESAYVIILLIIGFVHLASGIVVYAMNIRCIDKTADWRYR